MPCRILLLTAMTVFLGCNKKDTSLPRNIPAGDGYMPQTKGLKLTYTITSGDESGGSSVTRITDVYDSSGYTVAKGTSIVTGTEISAPFYMVHNKEKTIQTVAPLPVYYQTLDQLAAQFDVFTHEEHPYAMTIPHSNQRNAVVFPENIYTKWHSEQLDEEASLITDNTTTVTPGQIDSLGKVTIALGTFDCIRVHYISKGHFHSVATDATGQQVVDYETDLDRKEWFAPGIGFVKGSETNLKTGGVTITELTKIDHP